VSKEYLSFLSFPRLRPNANAAVHKKDNTVETLILSAKVFFTQSLIQQRMGMLLLVNTVSSETMPLAEY